MIRIPTPHALLPLLLPLLALPAGPLRAQEPPARPAVEVSGTANGTLEGVVTAEDTGEPLEGAEVVLPGTGVGTVTGPGGRFVIHGLPAGLYGLRVRAGGYTVDSRELRVAGGAAERVEVALQTRKVFQVAGIEVSVERERRGRLAGFLDRASSGSGRYITRDQIAESDASDLTSVFRRFAAGAMRVETCLDEFGRAMMGCNTLVTGARGRFQPSLRGGQQEQGGPMTGEQLRENIFDSAGDPLEPSKMNWCEAAIYLDGSRLPAASGGGGGIDLIPPEQVYGIEVYRSSTSAPAQYTPTGSDCGVVLIWTRTGEYEDEPAAAPVSGDSGGGGERGSGGGVGGAR